MAPITVRPAPGYDSLSATALPEAPFGAPLLVATDGSPSSDDALRAAKAIGAHTGSAIHMIAVHEPLPMLSPEVQVAQGPQSLEEARDQLRARVAEQTQRIQLVRPGSLEVVSGQPEAQIAQTAERIGASLVIMGMGGHGLYERLVGDEMVLRVLRLGTVPVLAVASGFLGLPTRVLVATDFSQSSVRAAQIAESIMAPYGRITVAHVQTRDGDVVTWNNPNVAFHGSIGRALDEVFSQLRDDIATDRAILEGDAAEALLEHALLDQSDMIATGSHGFGVLRRMWIGSVSQELVRRARCSVLVAPPTAWAGTEV